jgi:hypothetical protein
MSLSETKIIANNETENLHITGSYWGLTRSIIWAVVRWVESDHADLEMCVV